MDHAGVQLGQTERGVPAFVAEIQAIDRVARAHEC